jgi:hypothetical protein
VAIAPEQELMGDMKIDQASGKPPLFLIPLWLLIGLARVIAYGVRKYALGNWYSADLEDGAGERYLSAALRHMSEMQLPGGEPDLSALDEESGLPHIDHAICSLVMLRGIAVKGGVLPRDPGRGNEPIGTGR